MSAEVRIQWDGPALTKIMRRAQAGALDDIAQRAVTIARANHPRWQSRTGRSERAIKAKKARFTSTGTSVRIGFLEAVTKRGQRIGGFFQETGWTRESRGGREVSASGRRRYQVVRRSSQPPAGSLEPAVMAAAGSLAIEIARQAKEEK